MWIMENWDDKVKYNFWYCVYFKFRFWAGKLRNRDKRKRAGLTASCENVLRMTKNWSQRYPKRIKFQIMFDLLFNQFFFYLSLSFDWGGWENYRNGTKEKWRVSQGFGPNSACADHTQPQRQGEFESPSEIDFLGFFLKRQQCMDRLFT
jgi:hypothetical protein